jgi:hypothetical protein
MMEGGTFILLNRMYGAPKSAKQGENALTSSSKILQECRSAARIGPPALGKDRHWLYPDDFRGPGCLAENVFRLSELRFE